MHFDLLQHYITVYEKQFDEINYKEIYKWRAVQWFQWKWDIEADDFAAMLKDALKRTSNLMDSGVYCPRSMIIRNAERDPETVCEAFRVLFDEEDDLMDRITSFQKTLNDLTKRGFPGQKSFQDDRAVMVYLSLHYPNIYYLYKWTMFKEFVRKLDNGNTLKRRPEGNIIPYLILCERVREESIQHDSLLKRHFERIGATEYPDKAFHILTQDFIYAVTKYLTIADEPAISPEPRLTLTSITVEPRPKTPTLKGSFTDYPALQQSRDRIGNLGEELVFQVERRKYDNRVIHKSRVGGDGLGYDILSVDDDGGPKYIEVKTTRGGPTKPFFVTTNELKKSQQEGDRYYLYRLYNYDEGKRSADYYILQGDMSRYCVNPIQYEVTVELIRSESAGSL